MAIGQAKNDLTYAQHEIELGYEMHAAERVDTAIHRLGAAKALLMSSVDDEDVSSGPVFDEESGEGGL